MGISEFSGRLGAIGIAAATRGGPLQQELVAAAFDGAEEMAVAGRLVARGNDQSSVRVLLGLGSPPAFAKVFDDPRMCPRAVWIGEPLPALGAFRGGVAASNRARAFAGGRRVLQVLPRGRLRDAIAHLGGSTADLESWYHLDQALKLAGHADRFVVTSRDGAAILASVGVQADVVPFGYAAKVHGVLAVGGDRDIETLMLGGYSGPRSHRRRNWIEAARQQGLPIAIAQGEWGESRNALLRRSRVVLHIHRIPGTFIGLRLVLALAAGSVVVSEPMRDPHPFVPGIHFIEAPLDQLASEATALLADEARRRRIVEAGQTLLAEELTMGRCLSRVLDLAGANG